MDKVFISAVLAGRITLSSFYSLYKYSPCLDIDEYLYVGGGACYSRHEQCILNQEAET